MVTANIGSSTEQPTALESTRSAPTKQYVTQPAIHCIVLLRRAHRGGADCPAFVRTTLHCIAAAGALGWGGLPRVRQGYTALYCCGSTRMGGLPRVHHDLSFDPRQRRHVSRGAGGAGARARGAVRTDPAVDGVAERGLHKRHCDG